MDPLSEVYTGRDNTGSAAVFGNTPNQLGTYLKDQQAQELARIKAQPKPEQFDKSIDADLAGLARVYPKDQKDLTDQYLKVRDLKKQWIAEKDPLKRAEITTQYAHEKAKLTVGIGNSIRTIESLQKSHQYETNDKKHTLPPDFEDRRNAYINTPVWERPESFDYGVVNTMSAADNAFKRALGNMPKSSYTVIEVTPEGKQLTKAKKGISEADARKQFTADWNTAMPQNEKNMWRDITLEAASPSDGSAPDPHAVELIQKYGINDAAREFAIDMNMINAHNKLGEGIYKVQPAPKSATGGAGNSEFKGGSMNTVEVKREDGSTEEKTTVIPKTAKDYVFQFEDGMGGVQKATFMYISRVNGGDPVIVGSYISPIDKSTEITEFPATATNLSQIDKLMQTPDSYYQHIGVAKKKGYKQKTVYGKKDGDTVKISRGANAPKSTKPKAY